MMQGHATNTCPPLQDDYTNQVNIMGMISYP
jgi:hypothetical protein